MVSDTTRIVGRRPLPKPPTIWIPTVRDSSLMPTQDNAFRQWQEDVAHLPSFAVSSKSFSSDPAAWIHHPRPRRSVELAESYVLLHTLARQITPAPQPQEPPKPLVARPRLEIRRETLPEPSTKVQVVEPSRPRRASLAAFPRTPSEYDPEDDLYATYFKAPTTYPSDVSQTQYDTGNTDPTQLSDFIVLTVSSPDPAKSSPSVYSQDSSSTSSRSTVREYFKNRRRPSFTEPPSLTRDPSFEVLLFDRPKSPSSEELLANHVDTRRQQVFPTSAASTSAGVGLSAEDTDTVVLRIKTPKPPQRLAQRPSISIPQPMIRRPALTRTASKIMLDKITDLQATMAQQIAQLVEAMSPCIPRTGSPLPISVFGDNEKTRTYTSGPTSPVDDRSDDEYGRDTRSWISNPPFRSFLDLPITSDSEPSPSDPDAGVFMRPRRRAGQPAAPTEGSLPPTEAFGQLCTSPSSFGEWEGTDGLLSPVDWRSPTDDQRRFTFPDVRHFSRLVSPAQSSLPIREDELPDEDDDNTLVGLTPSDWWEPPPPPPSPPPSLLLDESVDSVRSSSSSASQLVQILTHYADNPIDIEAGLHIETHLDTVVAGSSDQLRETLSALSDRYTSADDIAQRPGLLRSASSLLEPDVRLITRKSYARSASMLNISIRSGKLSSIDFVETIQGSPRASVSFRTWSAGSDSDAPPPWRAHALFRMPNGPLGQEAGRIVAATPSPLSSVRRSLSRTQQRHTLAWGARSAWRFVKRRFTRPSSPQAKRSHNHHHRHRTHTPTPDIRPPSTRPQPHRKARSFPQPTRIVTKFFTRRHDQ